LNPLAFLLLLLLLLLLEAFANATEKDLVTCPEYAAWERVSLRLMLMWWL
jgi:hypothetical protein